MTHVIKSADDLRWLIGHTGGFRGGYVTDIHLSKRRLFDEVSGRDVLAGTAVSLVIRYTLRDVVRVAKLAMTGVTDLSIFEQEGRDCSALTAIQAEAAAGCLRFWFDPQGELYVVCEEVEFEEVSAPLVEHGPGQEVARWTFQSQTAEGPSVDRLLAVLDRAGIPCAWRAAKPGRRAHPAIRWQGDLIPDGDGEAAANRVRVMLYGALDQGGFGIMLRVQATQGGKGPRMLAALADHITQSYLGRCLVGTTIIPGEEWERWVARDGRSTRRDAEAFD
jgi:hypothetical protein